MGYSEVNKFDIKTSFGEASNGLGEDEPSGGASDFSEDAPSIPSGEFAGASGGAYRANNKFDASGRFGDGAPFGPVGEETGPVDFAADAAGVPNPTSEMMTPMDMALEGNKFPRETGHDSLTPEEAQLT